MHKISKFLPCMRIRIGTILGLSVQYKRLFRAGHYLISWPNGKCVYYFRTRGPGSIPGCASIIKKNLPLSTVMLNLIHTNKTKINFLTFYIELSSKSVG